ncbi:MAG: PadR family transcriptional regulator [Chloroflexi bacterium]|jgi:DNA-binding PadR family transcriptional regulator|nr:MAG: PadR family transcriptional regulator [Chloroflexota bacterium]TMF16269.1 MAG: PadR family transcriptional regulator [Chloroflexota bacterium]TMF51715.1 MAG: PadR family transcriptional regulator [Chloroflexota bacterium]TMG27297.1 MAG: PadR family transcriptional regulator [Chloroflexota bacterium]
MGLRDDASLLILTSLAGGPKHGYAMIEDIASITGIRLGPGTLYGAIGRLEAEGMIEALESDDRRRPYQITPQGLRQLEAEIGGMKGLIATGLRRLKRA